MVSNKNLKTMKYNFNVGDILQIAVSRHNQEFEEFFETLKKRMQWINTEKSIPGSETRPFFNSVYERDEMGFKFGQFILNDGKNIYKVLVKPNPKGGRFSLLFLIDEKEFNNMEDISVTSFLFEEEWKKIKEFLMPLKQMA